MFEPASWTSLPAAVFSSVPTGAVTARAESIQFDVSRQDHRGWFFTRRTSSNRRRGNGAMWLDGRHDVTDFADDGMDGPLFPVC
ncbi:MULTISPECIES: hypothetical protein [Alphaproteobacteria]|uniref:hypothetical protein n=1 Tax=Alphaproteobacteria TaxID=28211 RepID=UPI001140ADAC|nr:MULTISPECIES: hypothetical protein [Alphaproteobacteria]